VTVAATNSASASSLMVTGYPSMCSTSTSRPCAEAMPVSTSVMPWRTFARASGEKERTVASKWADAGMTFSAVPAWKLPTVTTTGSKMSWLRVTRVDNAVTISHAAGIGSLALCGREPWPPRPRTVTRTRSAADISAPRRPLNTPYGSRAALTCSP
jgi:hypothetical protein